MSNDIVVLLANLRGVVETEQQVRKSDLFRSMEVAQFDPAHPIKIRKSDGLLICGYHRVRCAELLGLTPTKVMVDCTDEEALQIAVRDNTYTAPVTMERRRLIARKLYPAHTMQAIGDMLDVNKSTVSDWLKDIVVSHNNVTRPSKTDKLGRKASSGRPKSTPKPGRISMDVRRSIASSVINGGLTTQQAEVLHGVSNTVVRREVAREQGRLEVLGDPPIDPTTLSKSAQEKLASALRQQKKEQALTYTTDVQKGVHEMLKDTVLPYYEDAKKTYERAFNSARGLMTEKEYKQLLRCLHPDTRSHVPAKDLDAAFMLVRSLELSLMLKEHRKNVVFSIPTTMEELLARKAAVTAARKAGRGGNMVRKH